jgi:hypothetical protein
MFSPIQLYYTCIIILFGTMTNSFRSDTPIPNIIPVSNLPNCMHCMHYINVAESVPNSLHLSKCRKFGKLNPTTNSVVNIYAYICREKEDLCGKHGKKFKMSEIYNILQ